MTSSPALAVPVSTGAAALATKDGQLFCDEADVVELVSESEILDLDVDVDVDLDSGSRSRSRLVAARDLPSVDVIMDEDPSVPATAASGPVPTQDMFADDDPTVRLGTLPPPPFPRHLSPTGSVPPPAMKKLGSALVPMEFLPSSASSSIAPISMDSTRDLEARRQPTMKIRAAGDEPSVVIVRGRPNVLWGALLVAAGVVGGIVCSQLLVTPADDVVRNTPATTLPSPAAQPAREEIAATPAPAGADHAPTKRAHVEPTSVVPVEAPARAATKPAPLAPAFAAAPATIAPKPAAAVSGASGVAVSAPKPAPQAPAAAQASLAKKAPAAPTPAPAAPAAAASPSGKGKSVTAIPPNELANDQAADALARAQLKAALR